MPGILTFDPATVTGWAWAAPGEPPQWGHERMAKVGAGPGKVGAAFDIFLQTRMDLFRPEYVAYEKPWVPVERIRFGRAGVETTLNTSIPMNADTIMRLMGMAFRIETVCEQWGIECREARPQEISKVFLGYGRFKKTEKKRRTIEMCAFHGWSCTEDEADALALLVYAESVLFPQIRRVAGSPLFPLTGRLTTAAESVQRIVR